MECSAAKDLFSLFPFPLSLLGGFAAAGRAGYAWLPQRVPAREQHTLSRQLRGPLVTLQSLFGLQ